MRTAFAAAPVAAIAIAALLGACAPNAGSDAPAPAEDAAGTAGTTPGDAMDPHAPHADLAAASDTLRGTLAVVGAEPLTQVVIRPADTERDVVLRGPALDQLRRLSGLEVRVQGRAEPDGRGFAVHRFEVRALEGTPAVDGVLTEDGDAVVLVRQDGRRVPLSAVPPTLRRHIGERVWVAGSPEGRVESYGVIGG